jgi:lipopolysaccharide/colanic/teichoic acid biosynthesis glycosyltransferase
LQSVNAMINSKHRLDMIEELYRLYGARTSATAWAHRIRFWRKKYAWLIILGGARGLKRAIDILVAGSMLLALIPLFLCVAVAIKLTDRGPVLFWQKRVGKWGREFPFPKFRSMVINAEAIKTEILEQSHHKDSVTFKMKKDPRVTWIGRIIRKVSIDELPQLWNVFSGDMSLVGPRPPVPEEVEQYTLSDRRRLDVKPGLTSFWAIMGRGDIPFSEQVQLDTDYIESQSILVDIKILLKTIPAVLTGRGAY